MSDNKSWTITIQEDPETGDAILEFPPDMLEATGWKEGDTLTWTDVGNGSWSLSKKGNEEMIKALTEFTNEEFGRTAIIYTKDDVYGVIMYRKGEVVEDRKVPIQTRRYAEDLAENWINKWGEFRV